MLSVENLTSGYGRVDILHEVSIRAQRGKITSLLGPNGAGKSTLLKSIFGILKPRSGTILLEGRDVTGLKPHMILRANVSYVLQRRSVFPFMTVEENLEMGAFTLQDKTEIRKRIQEVFDFFTILKEKRSQKAGKLSGGQQRMLELGRALMLRPKLLLLDEPSLGLAPKITNEVFEYIEQMKRSGITILMVEQNVRKALEFSDYTFLLVEGRNRFDGPSSKLLSDSRLVHLYLWGN